MQIYADLCRFMQIIYVFIQKKSIFFIHNESIRCNKLMRLFFFKKSKSIPLPNN